MCVAQHFWPNIIVIVYTVVLFPEGHFFRANAVDFIILKQVRNLECPRFTKFLFETAVCGAFIFGRFLVCKSKTCMMLFHTHPF